MCKKPGTSLEVEEGLKTTRQRLLLFAANFPTLRGEEVYLSTSGWSEVRTILRSNVQLSAELCLICTFIVVKHPF